MMEAYWVISLLAHSCFWCRAFFSKLSQSEISTSVFVEQDWISCDVSERPRDFDCSNIRRSSSRLSCYWNRTHVNVNQQYQQLMLFTVAVITRLAVGTPSSPSSSSLDQPSVRSRQHCRRCHHRSTGPRYTVVTNHSNLPSVAPSVDLNKCYFSTNNMDNTSKKANAYFCRES